MRGLRVAVTQGDAAGVGPEVLVKALVRHEFESSVLAVGCRRILSSEARTLGINPPQETVDVPWRGRRLPTPGRADRETGLHALECLRTAVAMARAGEVSAIVTGPVCKRVLRNAGVTHPGQTELLAEITGAQKFVMMLVGGELRVAVVTTHVSVATIAGLITKETVLEKLQVLNDGLRQYFGISEPRIAVLALNPHAGEGGFCGEEEQREIAPAVREATGRGMRVEGPLAADSAFGMWRERRWDALLAMFHDQGLAPLKAVSFRAGVNVTLGLPIVRTSPDHGTAFDIAGQGVASERSMVEAVRLARRLASRRQHQGGSGR